MQSGRVAGRQVESTPQNHAVKNILKTEERELIYRMEAKPEGFFQTAVLGTAPDTVSLSQRFDLVIGSGRKGQTYLYWDKGDRLYQLPVSYWTEQRQVESTRHLEPSAPPLFLN
jgi:hypothetical protein